MQPPVELELGPFGLSLFRSHPFSAPRYPGEKRRCSPQNFQLRAELPAQVSGIETSA
jgi:hypothetical protein